MNFRPLTQWPRKDSQIRKSGKQFQATYEQTIDQLVYEVDLLGGYNIVIQTNHQQREIRADGLPRKDAREPGHPGVVISFDSPHGPLMFACDTYEKWTANMRAIALTLENLRAVERYGATKHGEQYVGFGRIAAKSESNGFHSAEDAARFVLAAADLPTTEVPVACVIAQPTVRAEILRKAAANLHPDSGGDHEAFVKLQAAKKLLEAG